MEKLKLLMKTEMMQSLLAIAREVKQQNPEKIEETISGLESNVIEHQELGIPVPIDQQLLLLALETGKRVNEMLK